MLKKNLIITGLLLATISMAGCQGMKKKTGANGAADSGDMEIISGTFSQGIDAGTTFSDQTKCQIAKNAPGVEQHIFFEFDQSEVSHAFANRLRVQADYLRQNPNMKVKIEGNTDDRGSREYNVALGWKRAKAVAEVLKQYGVRQNQLVVTSFGAERPVAFGQTETAWRCNRRVDLMF